MLTILANSVGAVGMDAARAALEGGRSALDAVEAGIRPVEADPSIRSVGVGGWTNLLGEVELDAGIMDGRGLGVGAVGALRGVPHAISVAREVMVRLPHVLVVGDGAARFAAECGVPSGPVLTERAQRNWSAWLDRRVSPADRERWPDVPLARWSRLSADPETAGTVVFLVRDAAGDIAAGVSTCGWAYKYPGRLGDSPVPGAGFYADNRYGAAACTGMGELSLRAGTARSIVLYMKTGMGVREACLEAARDLRAMERWYRGGLTLHAIDASGEPFVMSLGLGRPWGYCLWHDGMPSHQTSDAVPEDW